MMRSIPAASKTLTPSSTRKLTPVSTTIIYKKHILSAGPAAYRVKEKYQHAQDEQPGIHNGANNAGHDDRSLVVFLCYRLIAQTCEEACRCSLDDADEYARNGVYAHKAA